MKFNLLLKNPQLLSILHNVLMNESTISKTFNVIDKKEYTYNQYSLLIVMDIVIKYQIIINDEIYHNIFLDKLEAITTCYQSHQDLVIKGNKILIDLASIKAKLPLTSKENKKQVLKFIYDKYIVEGYCFHSFPYDLKKTVEENGLTLDIDTKEINDLKKINYIFSNHNYNNIISKNLNAKSKAIYITDSPAMAYFYAFRSPEYMAELTSLSKYYNYIKEYDRNAFYEKDYVVCKANLVSLCKHLNMSEKEENTVIKTFNKRWNNLKLSESIPCIAFIKRNELAKDTLPDIEGILENVDKMPLEILVSKIIDSKYPVIRRYSNVNSHYLTVITMPSYKEIKNNKFIIRDKPKVMLSTEKVKEDYQEEKVKKEGFNFNYKNAFSYGNINVVALTGLLLITLGMTLTIIINVLGG